jgi:exonuclease SbcC
MERREALLRQKLSAEKDIAGLIEREKQIRASLDINIQNEKRLLERKEASQAAGLALGLEAGRPCPVCGSTDHPDPANSKVMPFTQHDLLRTAAESVMDSREKLSGNLEGQTRCRELMERMEAEIKELRISGGEDLQTVKNLVKGLLAKKEALEKELQSTRGDRERLRKLEDDTLSLRGRLEKELESRSAVMAENTGLEKERPLLRGDLGEARDIAVMIENLEKDISDGHWPWKPWPNP